MVGAPGRQLHAVRDPGPLWTPAASRARLDQLLSVPVEARAGSNSLPAYADISLQTVIRSMDYDRQKAILQTRLRDLGLAQYRMTPQFAALAGDYRRAIAIIWAKVRPEPRPRRDRDTGPSARKWPTPAGLEKTGRTGCAAAAIGIQPSGRKNPSSPHWPRCQ